MGGILPGSMPPSSKHLFEEGAVFDSFLLVRNGQFAEEGLEQILCPQSILVQVGLDVSKIM